MRKYLLSVIALCVGATLYAQTRTDYDAAVSRFQTFYNNNQPDSIFAMFSDHMKELVSLDKTKQITDLNSKAGRMISFEFTKEEAPLNYYKATFKNVALSLIMSLTKDNKIGTFRLIPYVADGGQKEKSNFVYKSAIGNIYGTLSVPESNKKVPVVLLIAGSGPADRNGNEPGMTTNSYKMLADSLLKEGIACLRYDKRAVGESVNAAKSEEDMRFDDMVDDAVGMIKMLKEDARFSKVTILGHSEGSLIGMIAANRVHIDGFISLAGAGDALSDILVRQLTAQSKELGAKTRIIVDSIMKGYTVKNVDTDLAIVFHPSVQPYLRSLFKYDPLVEIKKLKIPVLILQGTTDFQVLVSDAEHLKKAYPRATLKLIKGMSHVLKQGPEDSMQNSATYNMPALPLSPGLMPPVYQFIKGIK